MVKLNCVLVQEVLPTRIHIGSGRKDNDRYGEIKPLIDKRLAIGTRAVFNDRKGNKIAGTVVPFEGVYGTQVIDTATVATVNV